MKQAMWGVGSEGGYLFSDYDFEPWQTSILDYSKQKSWISDAGDQLVRDFPGKEVFER